MPGRPSEPVLHMSAFGDKADMIGRGSPLSRSLLGGKRTCRFAVQMSANDPKRTCDAILVSSMLVRRSVRLALCEQAHSELSDLAVRLSVFRGSPGRRWL